MAVLNYDILLTKKCNAYEKDYGYVFRSVEQPKTIRNIQT